ncbi:KUP/HAK/KT family potassium transporter [Ruficoccus amylovorans]|uniref:Probable potassium transport system protein Kup n=1 Tax=Ruficoccus amylovorans TaxID=1804625 RepID=A0A842HBP6_9BACT|nr:KUP/HAK/KT family potassium transporter [Ruficoccus amylovorans]MBC2593690.1 KUP/HAK/KT family potassium transporter [Ruficoccus amylovorans]
MANHEDGTASESNGAIEAEQAAELSSPPDNVISSSTEGGSSPVDTVRAGLTLAALGVVFGDIGTSPLYAMNATLAFADPNGLNKSVLGIVSLFFWTLMLVVTVKYLLFIMKADNEGEGGDFAMHALLEEKMKSSRRTPFIFLLIAFGAALLVGDGVITPSISVLSAIEGLEVAGPDMGHLVVPLSLAILIVLFAIQRFGTGGIGKAFGPVMLVWFAVLGALGAYQLFQHGPEVLMAVNPLYGLEFLWHERAQALMVLGGVVLCVTGVEALYADMGHFGRKAIQRGWLFVAMPGLLLNYFGQGALALASPKPPENLFFSLVPQGWMTWALVVLATVATVIASQAVISGVFTLTRQAIQLRYCPNLSVVHTSNEVEGQIYVPIVNILLCVLCVATVVMFKTSESLAAAYGMAVTAAMGVTSLAYFYVRIKVWKKGFALSLVLLALFWVIDLSFLASNVLKFFSGAYYPLLIAGGLFVLMLTWRVGRRLIHNSIFEYLDPLDKFLQELPEKPHTPLKGTAIFLTADNHYAPVALRDQIEFYGVLREQNILLTALPDVKPVVRHGRIVEMEKLEHGFYRITFRYGYRERPDLMELLRYVRDEVGSKIDIDDVLFHFNRERVFITRARTLWLPLKMLFSFLARNSRATQERFVYPPRRAVETVHPVFL